MASVTSANVAAGLRGAYWDPAKVTDDITFQPAHVLAEDGAPSYGILASKGGETTAVMAMHPREFLPNHYLTPEILAGGCAVWSQAPRSVGNDIRLEHERALLDVAAGVQFLRDRGFEQIILLGNSGGAGLFSFYCQQSNKAPEDRIKKTPAGKPIPLGDFALPAVDGVIFVSPHPGQGVLLMNALDPSVTDETDALSMNPALFPFNPANGFRKPPQSSSFRSDFVSTYRAAQRERVRRLDEIARGYVRDRMEARKRLKTAMDPTDMLVSSHTPMMTIWRTDADLRCFDLSLDPSERRYGSLWGGNPFVSNLGSVGFARTCTADSWLSTWSGLSSNAALAKTAPDITQPTLMIVYSGDNSVFPADADEIFSAIGSDEKQRSTLPGDHHGRAVSPGAQDGREAAGEAIRQWLKTYF